MVPKGGQKVAKWNQKVSKWSPQLASPRTWTVFNINEEASELLATISEAEASHAALVSARASFRQRLRESRTSTRKAQVGIFPTGLPVGISMGTFMAFLMGFPVGFPMVMSFQERACVLSYSQQFYIFWSCTSKFNFRFINLSLFQVVCQVVPYLAMCFY